MKRKAFTLIELMLALSLVVVAAALIGSLMQMYAKNFATRGEDIRRMQLARSILNMVAEDLRAVVTAQKYDSSVLEQQLGSGGGGGGAGGGGGSSASAGGATGGQASGAGGQAAGGQAAGGQAAGGQAAGGQAAGGSANSEATGTDAESGTVPLTREPGLYGTQYELTLDVSRLPRADEYIPAMGAMMSPTLIDVPGDIKTVSYFVQSPSVIGVEDTLSAFNDPTAMTMNMTSGLVRRQLDRAIIAYAEELGDTTRLSRTGDLIAPEVVSLEFSYFDGTQWLYEWDSSTQALPWLVQLTLGIQSATGEAKAELESGISLSALTYEQRTAYGIQVYELIVAIPGAQLKAASAATAEADSGMSSMGL